MSLECLINREKTESHIRYSHKLLCRDKKKIVKNNVTNITNIFILSPYKRFKYKIEIFVRLLREKIAFDQINLLKKLTVKHMFNFIHTE